MLISVYIGTSMLLIVYTFICLQLCAYMYTSLISFNNCIYTQSYSYYIIPYSSTLIGAKLSLIPNGSLAHRLSGLSKESFHEAFSDVYESVSSVKGVYDSMC